MILDRIVTHKRAEVNRQKSLVPQRFLEARIRENRPALPLIESLLAPASPAHLIAEVKRASPSKGVIRADFHPTKIARTYEAHGAAAISVLTDEEFFGGSLDYLAQVRAAVSVPLLRKEFIIDAYQIYESRAWRADAILLIVACLEPSQLGEYLALASELGLDALVEVHDEAELSTALAAGAQLIGVNNRNLHTFDTRLDVTLRLAGQLPPGTPLVSESGIFTRADVLRVAEAGACAVLVGEALMREDDIGAKVDALLGSGPKADAVTAP